MIHLFRPDSIDRLNGVSYALTLLSTPIKLRENPQNFDYLHKTGVYSYLPILCFVTGISVRSDHSFCVILSPCLTRILYIALLLIVSQTAQPFRYCNHRKILNATRTFRKTNRYYLFQKNNAYLLQQRIRFHLDHVLQVFCSFHLFYLICGNSCRIQMLSKLMQIIFSIHMIPCRIQKIFRFTATMVFRFKC